MADYTENFFTVTANASPIIKRVAAAISLQNDRYHFVNDLAKNEGMAFWGNAFILQGNRFLQKDASTATGNDTTVLIPMVLNNTQFVNGYLECRVSDSITVAVIKAREFGTYGYNAADTLLNAPTIAKVCMAFEYEIWGHNKFVVTNAALGRSLFGLSTTPRYQVITIKPAPAAGRSQSAGHFYYEYTMEEFQQDMQNNYTAWWYAQGYNIYPPGSTGGSGTATSGTGGWYSYPYTGYAHWLAGWQVTMEDAQKINNFTLNNIDMDDLDSCRQLVLKKLLNTNGVNLMGRILAKIDRGCNEPQNIEKFKVRYIIANIANSSAVAYSTFNYDPVDSTFYSMITLNKSIIEKSTDLFTAGTLIHETMHAYMASFLHRVKNNISLSYLQQMGYDSIFQEYIDTLITRSPQLLIAMEDDKEYHHNYWTGKLISKLAEALQLYDGNTIGDFNYYSYLSWKGLFETDVWMKHWSNYRNQPNWPITGLYTTEDSTRGLPYALTHDRLRRINNIITNEQAANDSARGKKPITGACY
jgi:hypothetical protein